MRLPLKTLAAAALVVVVGCSDTDFDPISPPGGETPQEPLGELSPDAGLRLAPSYTPQVDLPEEAGPALKLPAVVIPGGDPLVVDDDQVECPDAGFTTIQEAVDHAAGLPGSQSIEVCAGTYVETVVVFPDNPLQIKGHGIGQTIVKAPPGVFGPIVDVLVAGRVDIEKMTFDGQSTMGPGGLGLQNWGLRYSNTDGRVKEVEVKNIRNPVGDASGVGVAFLSFGGDPWENKLEKSSIINFTGWGVRVDGAGEEAELKENQIVGPTLPSGSVARGIEVARGAEAKVENNEIRDAVSSVPGFLGSAVRVFCAAPTTVKGNDIWASGVGVVFIDTQGSLAEDNTHWNATNTGHLMLFQGDSFDPASECPSIPTPTMHNTFKKNRVFDAALRGVQLSGAGIPPTLNLLQDNEVYGAGDIGLAVLVADDNVAKGNRVEDAGRFGIALAFGSLNRVESNESRRSVLEGLYVQDAVDNLLKKNRVEDADRNGMRLLRAFLNRLEESDVQRSNTHGIRVDQSDDNTLFKNLFKGSGRTGIRLFASDGNTVQENKVETSGFDGIHAFDNAEGNTFHKNDVKKSADNSCDDDSVGGGTAGTANTWTENKGEAPDDPDGICDG